MLRSKSIKEGSIGLFILLGLTVFGLIIYWLQGGKFNDKSYEIIAQFTNAGGLREGAKVRFRGIEIGRVTSILPNSNGVDVTLNIENNLQIPKEVTIKATSFGLLGETLVDIIPKQELTAEGLTINPLNKDCQESNLILCHQEKVEGIAELDVFESMTRLAEIYSNPELYNNINQAVKNTALAGEKFIALSDEVADFSKTVKKDLKTFSNTAEAFTNTANVASGEITRLSQQFSTTSTQINSLITNVNSVIDANKNELNDTVKSVNDTSKKLSILVTNLDSTVTNVNTTLEESNPQQIIKNLEEFSKNLEEISKTLNQPTNLVTLQQTLDSARVTFENTAKITSDLDEITGDPEFRNNVKKLVDGLSNLVSYQESLEKQIELAKLLEEANKISDNQIKENLELKTSANVEK